MESAVPKLFMRVVYVDADMIEFDSHLMLGDWSGRARAYVSSQYTKQLAEALAQWILDAQEPFEIEFGADTGIGWTCMRFYKTDIAGHFACHIRLSTKSSTGGHVEQIWRLSAEIKTEAGLIERFAHDLAVTARKRAGEATLLGVVGENCPLL